MADHLYLEERAQNDPVWVKLVDLGDGTFGLAVYDYGDNYTNITGAATTQIKSGAGVLKRIIYNKTVLSGTVTIYDNTAGSGTKIGTITDPAVALLETTRNQKYGCRFTTGLTIVTTGAADITVIWR